LSERRKEREEKDAFEVYQENVQSVINETTKFQAAYTQSVLNLQQEFTEAFKRSTESATTLQREFVNAIGSPTRFVEAYLKFAALGNKAAIASIDAARQNVRSFTDNIDAITKINLDAIKTWQSFAFPARA